MNLLYSGAYRRRFDPLIRELAKTSPASVLEICFGDIYIAEYCAAKRIQWKGIDINPSFVAFARGEGYDAQEADVLKLNVFPPSEAAVIAGALYHFSKEELKMLLSKIFITTPHLIVSEPIQNISNSAGLVGYLARRSSRTSKSEDHFRYDQTSLLKTLDELGKEVGFSINVLHVLKKDIIITLTKI
jgi:hypothetical protein